MLSPHPTAGSGHGLRSQRDGRSDRILGERRDPDQYCHAVARPNQSCKVLWGADAQWHERRLGMEAADESEPETSGDRITLVVQLSGGGERHNPKHDQCFDVATNTAVALASICSRPLASLLVHGSSVQNTQLCLVTHAAAPESTASCTL